MVTRRGTLLMVSVLCVLASASAHAAGEFEAYFQQLYTDSFRQSFMQAGGDQKTASQQAETAAECFMDHVMQEFRFDEVARLDAWVTNGTSPGKDIEQRLHNRLRETVLKGVCGAPAGAAPVEE